MFTLHRVRIEATDFPFLVLRTCEKSERKRIVFQPVRGLSAKLLVRLLHFSRGWAALAVTRHAEAVVAQTFRVRKHHA
ncbi:hypothetical protein ASC97_00550 [Rhizobium sp. Root1203]|nr:hypothetical protein ASC97_00550 [Rhizobium sp. Root1203]